MRAGFITSRGRPRTGRLAGTRGAVPRCCAFRREEPVGQFAAWTRRGHETCTRQGWVVLIALLAALVLGEPAVAQRRGQAPKKPQPAARKERPVPFAVGEKLTYEVSWSSYVTAGSATMTVQEKKPSYNSVAYYIYAEGSPTPLLSRLYNLYYKADSLLDAYSLLPQRASVFSREGRRQRMMTTTFDRKANTAAYTVETSTVAKTRLRVPVHARDPLSAIYGMRSMPLKSGARFSLPICNAGETYQVDVAVAAPERVETGVGGVRAWKITPTLPKTESTGARQLTLWLSDDARRLPVKMQAQLAVGTFDLVLRSVTP